MTYQFQPQAPEPKNSLGNGILIGVIIVLLIAVLAVGGWLVYTLTSSSSSVSDGQGSHKASSASSQSKNKDKAKSKKKESSSDKKKADKDSKSEDKAVAKTDQPVKPEDKYILVDAPSRNISCQIYDDRVGCSIAQRKYSELGLSDCPDTLYSIIVDGQGVRNACGTEFLGRPGDFVRHMEYGETVFSPNGKYQCNLEENGMTCRNTETRRGFKIARETQNKF